MGVGMNAQRIDDSSSRKIGLRSKEEIGLDEEMSKILALLSTLSYNAS
jgi:hypothetical protein